MSQRSGNPGTGGGLAHVCATATWAAPRFAVFEAWAPRTMYQTAFLSSLRDLVPSLPD